MAACHEALVLAFRLMGVDLLAAFTDATAERKGGCQSGQAERRYYQTARPELASDPASPNL